MFSNLLWKYAIYLEVNVMVNVCTYGVHLLYCVADFCNNCPTKRLQSALCHCHHNDYGMENVSSCYLVRSIYVEIDVGLYGNIRD